MSEVKPPPKIQGVPSFFFSYKINLNELSESKMLLKFNLYNVHGVPTLKNDTPKNNIQKQL